MDTVRVLDVFDEPRQLMMNIIVDPNISERLVLPVVWHIKQTGGCI